MSNDKAGGRMRERLLAQGFRRDDGEPDVQEFCWTFRFNTNHLYAWLRNDMLPSSKHLTRLCDALNCSERWLLTGEERDPKKAAPPMRRPRNKARVLWPALLLGAAAGLLPSPSAARPAHPLSVGKLLQIDPVIHLLGSWRRRFRNDFRMFSSGTAFAL